MKALVHHDAPDTLAQASRRSKSGRVAQRLLAIRDIMLGRSRAWVCAQYCVSRENLRHWVQWYNIRITFPNFRSCRRFSDWIGVLDKQMRQRV